jgi:hypothetical protein
MALRGSLSAFNPMLDQPATIWALFNPDQIPLWLKISYTVFICLVVPVNWVQYGPGNFLWFSDVAFLLMLPAVWLESSLLVSMVALAVVVLDLVWNVDFFVRLFSGISLTGISAYMFDSKIPLPIRAVSLFHIAFPVLLLWSIYRLGYDSRAFVAQTLLACVVLLLSYLLTDPKENVNSVHGFGAKPQTWMPAPLFVGLLMLLFPLILYLPTHLILEKLFG